MDHASGHAMNLSGKSSAQQQQRNSTGGGGSKSMHAQHANSFDVLSQFGGDIGAAVAAVAAASAASGNGSQLDGAALAAAAANFNALAQLNQLASHIGSTNPKVAAMLQLQQQHLMGQQNNSLSAPSMAQYAASSPSLNQTAANSLSSAPGISGTNPKSNHTRYQQLLSIIDEMGKDLRTTYLGNKNSTERLKRGIASARILVKDCQLECERNTKQ